MSLPTQLALGVAAIIHLLPLAGVLGPHQLKRLYGLQDVPADVGLLLRHRAVLFAGLGILLLVPLWRPEFLLVICGAGLVSAVSFLALASVARPLHSAMTRVVVADIIAIASLVFAVLMTLAAG